MKNARRIENYCNRHIYDLLSGRKIRCYNYVLWSSYEEDGLYIYAMSLDAYLNGVIDGYVCGVIVDRVATIKEGER